MSVVAQPVHFPSMRGHRFHLLDAMRGIAAILVVRYHTLIAVYPHAAAAQTWLAVDFFFLLSGFVLAYSYQQRLASGMRLRDFLAARYIRLYPLYLAGTLLGLVSAIVVQSLSVHVALSLPHLALSMIPALLLVPDFLRGSHAGFCFPLNLPAWSLCLELAANLLFAAVLRFRLLPNLTFLVVAAGSLTCLVHAALAHQQTLDAGSMIVSLPLALARVGFSFFTGTLVFALYRHRPSSLPSVVRTSIIPAVSCLALTAVLVTSSTLSRNISFQLAVIVLLFPALVYLAASSELPPRLNHVCALLGDISYPLYILHAALVYPLGGSKPRSFFDQHSAATPTLLLVILLLLLTLSWYAARYPDRAIRLWLTRHYNASATLRTQS